MDGSDLPAADRSPEPEGEGHTEADQVASRPERCEALAAAVAGVLGGALREHEERAAATARSQDELAAVIDRLNGGGFLLISCSFFRRHHLLLPCCHVGVSWLRVRLLVRADALLLLCDSCTMLELHAEIGGIETH
jgi:hypothetical protein